MTRPENYSDLVHLCVESGKQAAAADAAAQRAEAAATEARTAANEAMRLALRVLNEDTIDGRRVLDPQAKP